jgi:cobalt-zinc-cadmium efflux system outer membrane protein
MRPSYLARALIIASLFLSFDSSAQALSLEMAIKQSLSASVQLKALESAIVSAELGLKHAALVPNPHLSVDLENFGGSGNYRAFQNGEISYGLSQLIEIGGKARARIEVAEKALALCRYDHEALKLDIIRNVKIAYAKALFTEESLILSKEKKLLFEKLYSEMKRRVNAARESPLEQSKTAISLANADFALKKAERELEHSLHALSSHWGAHDKNIILDKSPFFTLSLAPSEEAVEEGLKNNPSLKRLTAETARRSTLFDLEKKNAIPDLQFNLGLRHFPGSADFAALLGISIALPLFNQNQGPIARAHSDMLIAEGNDYGAMINMRDQAFSEREKMLEAYERAIAIKNTIIPAAEKAFKTAYDGYLKSKYSYLEVIDIERILFDSKEQYTLAIYDYFCAYAEIDRLSAGAAITENIKGSSDGA